MKIKILDSVRNDLTNGYQFYEEQVSGLGVYFSNPYFQILIRLKSVPGSM